MQSSATTVREYLASLPEDRRKAMSAVRKVVRANLPTGVVESMNWGMISYEVPLKKLPNTYNGQPLMYAALASQKNYMSLYLMAIYGDDALRSKFEEAYRATGKRLNIGKACIRFKKLDDLPLEVVADSVGAVSIDEFISMHDQAVSLRKTKRART
jgi:hypothetical protein